MNETIRGLAPQPFFIERSGRRLFAIHHPPTGNLTRKSGIVFLPPFAEEMNRSRRMATLLAHAAAENGIDAMVFDLSGTGDSSGDFSAVRWETWLDDADAAVSWLVQRIEEPVTLVSLRMGAFLALETAANRTETVKQAALWQPVISGKIMLTQFLRVRIAAAITRSGDSETTDGLRKRLAAGETVEVGGYHINPELGQAIETLNLASAPMPQIPVYWLDVVSEAGREAAAAGRQVVDLWRSAGASVIPDTVVGEPFWSMQETTVVPALIDATARILNQGEA